MGTDYAALIPDPKVTVKGLSCPTTILVDLDLVPNRTEHSIGADRAGRHTQSTGPGWWPYQYVHAHGHP